MGLRIWDFRYWILDFGKVYWNKMNTRLSCIVHWVMVIIIDECLVICHDI